GLRYGSVEIAGACAAAAIWTPPGLPPIDDDESVALEAFFRGRLGARVEPVLEGLGRIDAVHPEEPHWDLGVVRTHPAPRGHRRGPAPPPPRDGASRALPRLPGVVESRQPRTLRAAGLRAARGDPGGRRRAGRHDDVAPGALTAGPGGPHRSPT